MATPPPLCEEVFQMSASDQLESDLLNAIFNDPAYTSPTNVYVALFTTAPSDAGGGTEVSGGAYARVSTSATDWNAASSGSKDNANAITFTTATASWGTCTHFALMDHLTASAGSNYLVWGALTTSKAVGNGDAAEFAAGSLSVSME